MGFGRKALTLGLGRLLRRRRCGRSRDTPCPDLQAPPFLIDHGMSKITRKRRTKLCRRGLRRIVPRHGGHHIGGSVAITDGGLIGRNRPMLRFRTEREPGKARHAQGAHGRDAD